MRKFTFLKGILTMMLTLLSLTLIHAQSAGTYRGGTVSYEVEYDGTNYIVTYDIEIAVDFSEFTVPPTGGELLDDYATIDFDNDFFSETYVADGFVDFTVTSVDAANQIAVAFGTATQTIAPGSFSNIGLSDFFATAVGGMTRANDLVINNGENNSGTEARLYVFAYVPQITTVGILHQSSKLSVNSYLQEIEDNETVDVTINNANPLTGVSYIENSAGFINGMDDNTIPFSNGITNVAGNAVLELETVNTPTGKYAYQVTAEAFIGNLVEFLPIEITILVVSPPPPPPPCAATISTGDTAFGGDPSVFYGGLSIYRNLFVDSDGSGPYTYNWVDAADPNTSLGTSRKLQVTPTQTTTYVGTVTDANNCSASASYTVSYEDITCGSSYWGSPKVSLCKVNGWGTNNGANPVTVCVSKYLAYWLVGFSGNSYYMPGACNNSSKNGVVYDLIDETTVYPNPNNGQFTLSYMLYETSEIEIQLTDMMGNVYYQQTVTEDADLYNKEMKFEDLNSGMYILTLKLNDVTIHEKIQIVR